jgi:hypothetical protein
LAAVRHADASPPGELVSSPSVAAVLFWWRGRAAAAEQGHTRDARRRAGHERRRDIGARLGFGWGGSRRRDWSRGFDWPQIVYCGDRGGENRVAIHSASAAESNICGRLVFPNFIFCAGFYSAFIHTHWFLDSMRAHLGVFVLTRHVVDMKLVVHTHIYQ